MNSRNNKPIFTKWCTPVAIFGAFLITIFGAYSITDYNTVAEVLSKENGIENAIDIIEKYAADIFNREER